MKKLQNTLLLLLLVGLNLVSVPLFAQGNCDAGDKDKHEKIKALKIAFITTRLNLTPAEAEQFFPLYNQYQDARMELFSHKRQTQQGWKDLDGLSETEAGTLVSNHLKFEQQELDLDKKYIAEFKAVLPLKKVALLLKAEHDFKREVLREWKNREGNGTGNTPTPR